MTLRVPSWARLLPSELSLPNAITWTTAAILVGGGASVVWLAADSTELFPLFFDYPGTLTILALNLAGFGLSIAARRQFSRGEPMHLVWTLLLVAAACNLAGGALTQVLGQNVRLNPFRSQPGWPGEVWRRAGLILGGPVQTTLLLTGLAFALRIYRNAGIQARPRRPDWVLMGIATVFSAWEISDFVLHAPHAPVSFRQAINVTNDPLLSLLLIEAILIRRSALAMGRGLIARCWGAFTAGILLTFVGDIALWLSGESPIPLPLTATTWYLWFLVSGAYALAPAYQLEACRRASQSPPSAEARSFTVSVI